MNTVAQDAAGSHAERGHWFTAGTALYLDDCLNVLAVLADESVDSVVTDPPYGLAEHKPAVIARALAAWLSGDRVHVPDGRGFMGRGWDRSVPPPAVWDECYRVLRPGGWVACFAGTRTADLMTLSLRLAGFEIRDSLHWIYGSGFPKSLDVSKAIDKAAGAEREVVAEGARWEGWGTALKPAHEPVILARKPLTGTVVANVLAHGTGALNVDGCRVECSDKTKFPAGYSKATGAAYAQDGYSKTWIAGEDRSPDGRWPPNVLLTHSAACSGQCAPDCPVSELDRQSGVLTSGANPERRGSDKFRDACGEFAGQEECVAHRGADSGGASRFYPVFRYQAKAGRRERPAAWLPDCGCAAAEAGLVHVPGLPAWSESARDCAACGKPWRKLAHPTVKPLELMRWLVRLVTPPGGVVLDPFTGTGVTMAAAVAEGMRVIACDNWLDAIILTHVRLWPAGDG